MLFRPIMGSESRYSWFAKKPSSRAALMGEQPNPWDLLQPQDADTARGAVQQAAGAGAHRAKRQRFPLVEIDRFIGLPGSKIC